MFIKCVKFSAQESVRPGSSPPEPVRQSPSVSSHLIVMSEPRILPISTSAHPSSSSAIDLLAQLLEEIYGKAPSEPRRPEPVNEGATSSDPSSLRLTLSLSSKS